MTRPSGPGHDEALSTADPGDFPESPYPGARPQGSWRLAPSGRLHALESLAGERIRDLATGVSTSSVATGSPSSLSSANSYLAAGPGPAANPL